MSEEPEELPDIATLYPADFGYWRDFVSATPYDLVLLSLGIEPRTIAELSQLDGMAEEDAEELHLGRQQEEFRRRLATLENHRLNGTVATVQTEHRTGPPHIRIGDFQLWATAQGWSLPAAWLSGQSNEAEARRAGAAGTPSPREQQRARTQERYLAWQTEADRLWEENPNLSKSDVARRIARNDAISGGKDHHTIRKHIAKSGRSPG